MNPYLLPTGLFLLAALTSPISEATPTPLAAGVTHTFAVKNNGTSLAWGNAASIWNERITIRPEPQTLMDGRGQTLTGIKAVAGSGNYYLALNSDGSLFSWRTDNLANGQFDNRIHPVPVVNNQGQIITGVRDIAVGSDHAVALKSDGTLLSWGINRAGQLGNNTTINSNYPVTVNDAQSQPIADIRAIAAAGDHTLAVKNDGRLLAWGNNKFGELGNGGIDNQLYPAPVVDNLGVPLTGVESVATGINHTLALKNDGTLLAWGSNAYGQLGSTSPDDQRYPVTVVDDSGLPIEGVQSISAGWNHSLAIKNDGTMLIWGNNGDGQLGNGLTSARAHPMIMTDKQGRPLTGIIMAVGGKDHTAILKTDGTVQSWGDNSFGQLGDGTTADQTEPVEALDENDRPVTDTETTQYE